MSTSASEIFPIRDEQHVVLVRQAVRRAAQAAGLSLVDQTKLVTAASELARNTLIHGGGGEVEMQSLAENGRKSVRLEFRDQGPGIPDMDLALKDGWTSGSGLGMGLSGSRRLVNFFDIKTAVGVGTSVTIARWK
jgi:serine/threonine-protein kinase RsbT